MQIFKRKKYLSSSEKIAWEIPAQKRRNELVSSHVKRGGFSRWGFRIRRNWANFNIWNIPIQTPECVCSTCIEFLSFVFSSFEASK